MNRGLEMARGEYVGILESDDFMFEDSLQKLVAKADAEHADVVKGDFYLYWSAPSERRELFGIIDEHMTGAAYRPVDRPWHLLPQTFHLVCHLSARVPQRQSDSVPSHAGRLVSGRRL